MEATVKSGRRIKRSLILDTDMDAWLRERAAAASASESVIVRQVLRAAMNAEQEKAA